MKSQFTKPLAKGVRATSLWQFWLIVGTALLALVDVFMQRSFDSGLIYSIASLLFFVMLSTEIYLQVVKKRTWATLTLAVYICVLYIATDVLIYTTSNG